MIESGKLIGFGIIGSGFMGRTHAETISTLVNGARLVSISGGPKAASLAAEYGVQSFAPCEETFMRDDVDVVVLATPHNVHAEHAIAAAKAGKHLLVEKPMACSVEQCDAIIAACRPAGLKCAIMYTHRNRIGCLKARELIASGRLGRVVHIRSYQIVPGGMAVVPPWQLDAENLGLLFGHGIHNLDALRWFSGQDIHAIYAKCRN
ncbi:MAG: Gfo/Idh/MocA family oxidoreductase, partial [Phycisphaerae bacterium]|nr:Gfo/Idh/MocA family oxidoreductase [Phycisphaerae bacterium]